MNYQLIFPLATYAPWLGDQDFQDIYDEVRRESLVSIFQCWELWQLVEETNKISGDLIEIGTYKGATAKIMATKLQSLKSTRVLYCCDTFKGVVKTSSDDNFYVGGEHADVNFERIADSFYKKLELTNVQFLKGIFPDDTGDEVSDKRFRLCHIDVDAHQSGKDVVKWIWPRLEIGGVIIFSDYGFPRTAGITSLANSWRGRRDSSFFHNLNGNAVIVKLSEAGD